MLDERAVLDRALALHGQGNIVDAKRLYRSIIEVNPNNIRALHFLGVAEAAAGNLDRARSLIDRSLQSHPVNFDFVENYATVLHRAREYGAVTELCDRFLPMAPDNVALQHARAAALMAQNQSSQAIAQLKILLSRHPSHAAAHAMLGSALARTRQFDAALASFDRALALNPKLAEAHLDKGTIHFNNRRYQEAVIAYDQALAARPGYAEAHLGRCYALIQLGRQEEALTSADQALSSRPDFTEAWVGRGNALLDLNRLLEAAAAYAYALAAQPNLAAAWSGHGNVLFRMGRHAEAHSAFDRALAIDPTFDQGWLGRGRLLLALGRPDEALESIDRAVATNPTLASAWLARGQAFYLTKRYADALADWTRSLELDPDQTDVAAACLRVKMHLCDWSGFDEAHAKVAASVRAGKTVAPFMFVAVPSTAAEQLKCAQHWVERNALSNRESIWRGERYNHDRIRIAYLSADLHQHATSQLMAGVLEHHDRSQFEISAISVGPNDQSSMRRRIEAAFEHFTDASMLGDFRIAEMIRATEIDILVDLKGYTQGARTGVFAVRPAPIQVNYLGFPGTIGANFIDYIIADRHIIPEHQFGCYAEKIVWLPDSYQANDDRRPSSDGPTSRSDHGLPEEAFVFCCFNDDYKITPSVFSSWMRILKAVDDSVLWLFEENPQAARNLQREALARGVAPMRLVFARHLPHAEHLARQRCADLFLDTLPYNAHTTASDALWAGLPVLSCPGETFAGRVGASLLNAVGLPELVASSAARYEEMAIELATNRTSLHAVKAKLAQNRPRTALFDTARYTKRIEAAYSAMMERHRSGLQPDHIDVAPPTA
jgi:protein O-GlcNAc transferase